MFQVTGPLCLQSGLELLSSSSPYCISLQSPWTLSLYVYQAWYFVYLKEIICPALCKTSARTWAQIPSRSVQKPDVVASACDPSPGWWESGERRQVDPGVWLVAQPGQNGLSVLREKTPFQQRSKTQMEVKREKY